MRNREYPRLCGGTFMTLVIQALLPRKKAREHYVGESDKLNDPDVLVGLIKVINPDYREPYKGTLKTKANEYKSCKLSKGQYLPFGDKVTISVFDERVKKDYASARMAMSTFIENFIETGTTLKKDERLVKALIDLIQQDDSIEDDVVFLIGRDGQPVRKDRLDDMYKVCLPAFLLGVWHFIVVNRKDNKIGQDTYDIWCPKNDHGPREYQGVMGESIARKIDVYTLNPDEIEGSVEPQVEEKISQADRVDAEKDNAQKEAFGTGPNLQQINNPFTFIQNGDNNTQIGYIANQTIVKK